MVDHPSANSFTPPSWGQHARVLDDLGRAICAGEHPPGEVLTLDEIEQRYHVSRTVAREAIRVLESMRMVRSRRRVGVSVLESRAWNVFDPQLIRWRLESSDRVAQLEAFVELRSAIEPEAAKLASQRIASDQIGDLIGLAGRLWAAGDRGDGEAFLELDVQFHESILEMSGNPMFAAIGGLVREILVGRTAHGLVPTKPDPDALQLHVDVANAIQRRDGEAAAGYMRSILERTIDEIEDLSATPAPIKDAL